VDEVAEDFEAVALFYGLFLEKLGHYRDPVTQVLQLGVPLLQFLLEVHYGHVALLQLVHELPSLVKEIGIGLLELLGLLS